MICRRCGYKGDDFWNFGDGYSELCPKCCPPEEIILDKDEREPETVCQKCKSQNWRCWDERWEGYWVTQSEYEGGGEYYVTEGYFAMLACKDCGAGWREFIHGDLNEVSEGGEE